MKILVIGTGMYVTGRKTKGFGTIFPSIIEFQRMQKLKKIEVVFVGKNFTNSTKSKEKVLRALKLSGLKIKTTFYPNKKDIKINNLQKIFKKEKKIDCAIVAVPDHLHFDISNKCLDNNIHTFVVKPFTTKINDAKKLIAKKKNKKLFGLVEFHKRFDRHNQLLKNVYESEKLGDPLYFNVEYSQKKIIPETVFSKWASKTNILQYLGVHYIDLVYFITKAKPIRVMAMGQKNWLISKGINTFDSIQCLIEWKTKTNKIFNQTLVVNWIDPNNSSAMSYQKVKFCGTKGNIESDQKNRGINITSDVANYEEPNPDFCQTYKTHDGKLKWKGYGIESVLNFLNGIKQKSNQKNSFFSIFSQYSTSFEDASVSTAVIEAATKSLKNNFIWKKIKF